MALPFPFSLLITRNIVREENRERPKIPMFFLVNPTGSKNKSLFLFGGAEQSKNEPNKMKRKLSIFQYGSQKGFKKNNKIQEMIALLLESTVFTMMNVILILQAPLQQQILKWKYILSTQ
nr:hypothetical protein Iba_chr07aCG15840 [Ipomoea batatas]